MRRLLVETGVGPDLGPAAAAQLRVDAPPPDDDSAVARFLAASGRLLLDYLRQVVNLDPQLERLLAAARAGRLREWTAAGEAEAAARAAGSEGRIAAALAIQCFHNEYAWYASPEEEALLAAPAARLDQALAAGGSIDPGALAADLLLVSLYRPASALAGADRLASVGPERWPPPVAELLGHSLHGPREELRIARELPSLAAVRDPISRAVRAQYEENPYPRWLSLPPGPDLGLAETLARTYPDRIRPRPHREGARRGRRDRLRAAPGGSPEPRRHGAVARSQSPEPRIRRAHGPPARDRERAIPAGRSPRRRFARRALRRNPRKRGAAPHGGSGGRAPGARRGASPGRRHPRRALQRTRAAAPHDGARGRGSGRPGRLPGRDPRVPAGRRGRRRNGAGGSPPEPRLLHREQLPGPRVPRPRAPFHDSEGRGRARGRGASPPRLRSEPRGAGPLPPDVSRRPAPAFAREPRRVRAGAPRGVRRDVPSVGGAGGPP